MLIKPWSVFTENHKAIGTIESLKTSIQGECEIYQSIEVLSKKYIVKEIPILYTKHGFKKRDFEVLFNIKHKHIQQVE